MAENNGVKRPVGRPRKNAQVVEAAVTEKRKVGRPATKKTEAAAVKTEGQKRPVGRPKKVVSQPEAVQNVEQNTVKNSTQKTAQNAVVSQEVMVRPVGAMVPKNEQVQEQPKANKKKENVVVNVRNSLFMLGVLEIMLIAAYFLTYTIISIVSLVNNGAPNWVYTAMQACALMFLLVAGLINVSTLRKNFKAEKFSKYTAGEIITELAFTITGIIGYNTYFVLLAAAPLLIAAAIELWVSAYANKK